jgi:putative serine protease PepD
MRTVLALALAVGLVGGGAAGVAAYALAAEFGGSTSTVQQSSAPLGAPAAANRAPHSVAGIAKQVLPSVVSINVSSGEGSATGSGFVIRDDGYILTNNHVVSSVVNTGGRINVVYNNGSSSRATVVGNDPYSDVAVVKVAKSGLKPVVLGNSDSVVVGDPVVAIGSPLGLQGTVTAGIVSALHRPVQAGEQGGGAEASNTYLSAIQTDAPINPGNSGGPLVDGAGRVIGIDSAIAAIPGAGGQAGSIGLGFAIPINQAKRIAGELIKTGHASRTVIGATVTTGGNGVRLVSVPPGPARKAGLRSGDLITKLAGQPITDSVDLIADIRALAPGTQVNVTYLRGGRPHTASVTLGEQRNN